MNPRPLLLTIVSHRDIEQCKAWLRWLFFLGDQDRREGSTADPLVIFCSNRVPESARAEITKLASRRNWGDRHIAVCPDEDPRGYPAAASHIFLRALEHCERTYPGRSILFCEPDCIPMRPSWFKEIADEYEQCGKAFMGAQVDHKGIRGWHLSGNSCYPHDWRQKMPSIFHVATAPDTVLWGPGKGQAWDIWCKDDIVADAHITDKIEQIFHAPPITPDRLSMIRPTTALFHRSKDGCVIASLARTLYPDFIATLPKPSRFFCLSRHPAQLQASGYQISGWQAVRRPGGQLFILQPTDPLDELVLSCLAGSKGVAEITAEEFGVIAQSAA